MQPTWQNLHGSLRVQSNCSEHAAMTHFSTGFLSLSMFWQTHCMSPQPMFDASCSTQAIPHWHPSVEAVTTAGRRMAAATSTVESLKCILFLDFWVDERGSVDF